MKLPIAILVALLVLSYFYILSFFLRGSSRKAIERVLALSILGVLVASFLVVSWKFGLVALVCAFVFTAAVRPIAAATAFRVLGYRTGIEEASDLPDIQAELLSGKSLSKISADLEKDKLARRLRLQSIAARPDIHSVLESHDVSFERFCELFESVWSSSLHDLAWEIVSDCDDLEWLIILKDTDADDVELWEHFRRINPLP